MGATPALPHPTFELEVSLRRGSFGRYAAELRFQDPESDAETRFEGIFPPLDLRALEELRFDPFRYGKALGRWIMSARRSRAALESVVAQASAASAVLRVRLNIGDDAAELHRVRWETARLPGRNRLLFVGENVIFSRYVNSTDYRRVQRRPQGELRALVVVADPSDIADYQTSPDDPIAALDREREVARAREALHGIAVDAIGIATLDAIFSALRVRAYDILYLVCHGAIVERQPHLWLQAADGTANVVEGDEFTTRIAELRQRPSLIVLASCESAGSDEPTIGAAGVLAALGPHLAQEGIPAVLALQGSMTVATAQQFMPRFFSELAKDGQIDRAVAVARGVVRDRLDAYVPVLFSRLKGGGIWYRLGWDSGTGFQRWGALSQAIVDGKCTPILGPGLVESIQGSRREIARELSEQFHFPLAPQDRDELPQVSQYWLVQQSRDSLVSEYLKALCQRIQRRYADVLPPALVAPFTQTPVPTAALRERAIALLAAAWDYRTANESEPHALLAKLDFPVYITTNPDSLLQRALAATARTPRAELFRWAGFLADQPSLFDDDPGASFEPAAPLIFHLFGQLEVPESLVLAQDDYFDALITASSVGKLPRIVRTALTNRTLLFLGFNIDDWNFRVLFRFILNLPGSELLRKHPHVAVQIDPEEQRFYDPRAARRYLEQYFGAQKIDIYWGTVDDFIRDLEKQHTTVAVAGATP